MDTKKIWGGRTLRIAIEIIMLVLLFAGGANANKIITDDSTGGDCTSIGFWILNTKTCTLTNDSTETVQIDSDGIILDGNGRTITGNDTGNGVILSHRTGVTIKNLNVESFYNGIYLESSSNNMLISNNVSDNTFGIHIMYYSDSNNLSGNNASNNYDGINLYYSSNNNNLSGNNASNNTNGIFVQDSSNNKLTSNIALNNSVGIYLLSPTTLIGNNASNNNYGIYQYMVSNSNLTGNIALNNNFGIYLAVSSNNMLSYNTASNNGIGIVLYFSSNNNILKDNIASNNNDGIHLLENSNNNTLRGNIVSNNNDRGIYLYSYNNENNIYNNFFNNTNNYNFSEPSQYWNCWNYWNTTKTSGTNIIGRPYLGGNFWANPSGTGFSETCSDNDKDGICNSPYILYTNNIDYLPLAPSSALSVLTEIHGMIFNDLNGNGTKDIGESGIYGLEIHLIRMISPGDEYLVRTAITNISGNYDLMDLSPGFYRVEELPGEFVQTYPANGIPHFIDLKEGEIKTGINFGDQQILPGKINGMNFNDSNANGVLDDGEPGIPGISICLSPSWRCNTTDSSGNYSFSDVSPGNYVVYENLSSEYLATTPTMGEIVVNSGEVKVINFGSRLPVPPPEDISVEQQSGEQNGVPTVFRPSLTVLTITKNLTNISENVVSVNLTMNWSDGTSRNASMTEIGNTNVWTADFNTPFPGGVAQMRFEADVAPAGQGMEDAIEIGDIIFIDPSGVIKDAYNGSLISGATVTLLYEYPPGTKNFIESPHGNQIPVDNPLITGIDGKYSWLTIPGTYRVIAEKAGYISAESDNVTIPPPVTDLNISLIPILPTVRFINGTVRDSVDKNRIAGVKVFTNTSNSTKTNESGFYSLAVTSGTYNITATFDPTYYQNSTTVSTVFSAVVVQDFELLMKKTGNISGLVR